MRTESYLRYLEHEKRYSAHTLKSYTTDLLQFSAYLEAQYQLNKESKVELFHIRSWIVTLVNQKLTAKSINRKLSTLKSYFKYLQKRGDIKKNPAALVRAPKIPERLPKTIAPEKIELLLEKRFFGDDFTGRRDKLILALLFETGIRLSELIGMLVEDINWSESQIKVLGKRKKERLVHFSSSLRDDLKSYLEARKSISGAEAAPQIFLTPKAKPIYPNLVHRVLKKYLPLVSTSLDRHPHILRHTFATALLNNGADLNAIKELLGHSSLAATQVYTHNSIEKMKVIYNDTHPKA